MVGCTTPQDVINAHERGEGISETYPVTMDEAFEIAKAVFRWDGSELIEEHRLQNYMLTEIPEMNNKGALCGAWFASVDPNNTRVTVITKRRDPASLLTPLTEATFQKDFAKAVDLLRATKQLPVKKPD
jgi:hypothetical protein